MAVLRIARVQVQDSGALRGGGQRRIAYFLWRDG
jgi:hypothetical protein